MKYSGDYLNKADLKNSQDYIKNEKNHLFINLYIEVLKETGNVARNLLLRSHNISKNRCNQRHIHVHLDIRQNKIDLKVNT